MTTEQLIKETQSYLKRFGFYSDVIDGLWGPKSEGALQALLTSKLDVTNPIGVNSVCWGIKFSDAELTKLSEVVRRLELSKGVIQYFMACIAWETGEKFTPDVKSKSSNAHGLIQFMPATAEALGTNIRDLAKMTILQQLEYVYKYFEPYKGRLNNLGDIYMAILWPKGIGKEDNWVLWDSSKSRNTYLANKGLDVNKDGLVTRGECCHKVRNKLVKGFDKPYCRAA